MTDFKDSMDHEANANQKLRNQHWRLSKEVSIATLITVFGAMGTGLWHIAELKNQQQLIQARMLSLQERVDRADAANDRTIVRIESTVTRIEQRLNQIVEQKR